MNVLCVGDRDFGTGRYSMDHPILEDVLARRLPARGHGVTFWAHSDGRSDGGSRQSWHGSSVELLPSAGRVPARRAINALLRMRRIRGRLPAMLADGLVDVMLVRNDWVAATAARPALRRAGVPLVFMWSFPHPLARLAAAEDQALPWRALSRWLARVEAGQYRRILRQADHVIAISEWMKAALVAEGVPAHRITPLPLGFDAPPAPVNRTEARASLGLGESPVVLYFGELSRIRRMEFLLDVMRRVLAAEPSALLLVAGAGDTPADERFLHEYAEKLGIGGRVRFLGRIVRSKIPSLVAAADVGVSPIRPIPAFAVSSPTKFIEMLGMGCPVVANDIPEQRAILDRTGAGLLVPYEVEPFADAIVQLLRDPVLAADAARRGRAFVADHRSMAVLTDTLEGVLAGVAGCASS